MRPMGKRTTYGEARRTVAAAARTLGEGLAETLYPTRCAVCDRPGYLLCPRCEAKLRFVDYWAACPRCGSAWGRLQCTECNPVSLGARGLDDQPFATCRNALAYDERAKRIVSAYKDQGEQRLAGPMSRIMAAQVSPELAGLVRLVTFVPATGRALRRRGFDHGLLLARGVGAELGKPPLPTLERPRTLDQRALGTRERMANMRGAFSPREDALASVEGAARLRVDDVMTTGSTLADAAAALSRAGAGPVHALTFAHA